MDFRFSPETLRRNLEELAKRTTAAGQFDSTGRAVCAEARFEVDHTVQRMAYLAHLSRESTN